MNPNVAEKAGTNIAEPVQNIADYSGQFVIIYPVGKPRVISSETDGLLLINKAVHSYSRQLPKEGHLAYDSCIKWVENFSEKLGYELRRGFEPGHIDGQEVVSAAVFPRERKLFYPQGLDRFGLWNLSKLSLISREYEITSASREELLSEVNDYLDERPSHNVEQTPTASMFSPSKLATFLRRS